MKLCRDAAKVALVMSFTQDDAKNVVLELRPLYKVLCDTLSAFYISTGSYTEDKQAFDDGDPVDLEQFSAALRTAKYHNRQLTLVGCGDSPHTDFVSKMLYAAKQTFASHLSLCKKITLEFVRFHGRSCQGAFMESDWRWSLVDLGDGSLSFDADPTACLEIPDASRGSCGVRLEMCFTDYGQNANAKALEFFLELAAAYRLKPDQVHY